MFCNIDFQKLICAERIAMAKRNAGFTLIELIVVITILGLLAGLALPKFASLQADARLAKMHAALGSVKAAAAMSHATLITRGFPANFSGTPSPAIVIDGTTVVYENGYPTAASVVTLAGLEADYVTTGLTAPRVAAPDNGHTGKTASTDCTIGYIPPATANKQPTYSINATVENCV